nr:hypothetical protein [Nitrosomonas nitrosa]
MAERASFEGAIKRISGGDHWSYAGTYEDLGFTLIHFKAEDQAAEMERWLAESGLLERPARAYREPHEAYAEEEAKLIAWGKQTRALHVTLQVYRWTRWATASDARAFEWAVAVVRTMKPSLHKPDAERAVKLMLWWAQREHPEWISKNQ